MSKHNILRILPQAGCILVAAFLFTPTANAQPKVCKAVASGIKSAYMADNGEGKFVALKVANKYCARKRVSRLSIDYRNFNSAVENGDTAKIVEQAKILDKHAHRTSKMMTSCWNTMLRQAKLVGSAVNDGLKVLSAGACE